MLVLLRRTSLLTTFYGLYFSSTVTHVFLELGGGVDDVPGWCRDGAHVELGFQ